MGSVLSRWISLVMIMALAACSQQEESPGAGGGMGQMPPPPVTVAKAQSHTLSEWKEYTGRLEGVKSIVVMPRTSGYIVEVGFEDGQQVKKGDLLFQVDYRTIAAEVEQLKAEVIRNEAQIELTERDLNRAESLRATNALSQEQLDNRRTQLKQARAAAESARADLRRAQVLLAITRVKAEFDGQVSYARVEVGSSVLAGQTVLTTLVATEQVHAYFDVDEPTFLKLKALGLQNRDEPLQVEMGLVSQSGFPYSGTIDFVDNQVDPATGTIRMRAIFDNADGTLTPGLFARVKLQFGASAPAIVIPERAIATDLSSKYVLVVNAENTVEYRAVELGPRRGEWRVITSGLEADETIIVSGLLRARPGTPVTPNMSEPVFEQ